MASAATFELVDIAAQINTDYKFMGAAVAPNGKIVFTPLNADAIGVFDATDNTFALVNIAAQINTERKFLGGAVAPNGKIVFGPYKADAVGVLNGLTPTPTSTTTTLTRGAEVTASSGYHSQHNSVLGVGTIFAVCWTHCV